MTTRDPTHESDPDSNAPSDPPDPADSPSPPTSPERPTPDLPRSITSGRPRVVEATLDRDRGGNAVVRVRLVRGESEAEARREAVGEEAVLLRCAAEVTLDALHSLMGPPARFALVGAKRMVAFDAAVLLACVRTVSGPERKLIGCVPIREDPVDAVARAVLHATNRIIEAIPNVTGGWRAADPTDAMEATAFDPDDPALDEDDPAGTEPEEED